MHPATIQRSFDDLGVPLSDVTFVVIDLETTGGSPVTCAITEVGAVKLRGGVCLGTFQTLVNPGTAVPPLITHLTGITEGMVGPAPTIDGVLPSLLEFLGDAVVVGHNVAFDLRFLDAALAASGQPRIANRVVDTCALARRLVRDEVPNCKLETLADRFRLAHRPSHRALDDALATGDLLHVLFERAAAWGVLALEDLVEMPTTRGHPHFAKRTLTADLPSAPGVYLMRDRGGRVLYVGRAVDLRRRVRSYFGAGEDRRKAGPLLRELHRIDHVACSGELEAGVLEVRLIHSLAPRFNRAATTWHRYVYVKLTLREAWPRLSVVRTTPADGSLYVGPLASTRSGRLVVDAVETAVGLRRCRARVGASPTRAAPCVPAQLGVARCPCSGEVDAEDYAPLVATAVAGLGAQPELLLEPLAERLAFLARSRRFEEAADVRDRAAALARALARQQRFDALRAGGRVVLHTAGEGGAVIDGGRLLDAWAGNAGPHLDGLAWSLHGGGALDLPADPPQPAIDRRVGVSAAALPVPREDADELLWITQWLDRRAGRIRVVEAEGALAWPARTLPTFEPGVRLAS